MLTWVAVALAVVGAACFAASAVHQHTAVSQQPAGEHGRRAMSLRSLGHLVRGRRWLLGMGFAAVGGALAMVALSLAPLAVIQPVGVLSVPFALLVSAVRRAHAPSLAELMSVLATVAGTGAFVWFVSGTAHSRSPEPHGLVLGAVAVVGLVLVLGSLGRFGPYRWHAVAWTAGGACLYGMGTTMVKSIFLLWQSAPGGAALTSPSLWAAAAVAVISFAIGVWMVQHAYVAGSPQVVVAGLTVVDPLICVVLGFTVLGEGGAAVPQLLGMLLSGAVAVGGVLQLARSQALTIPEPPHQHDIDPSAPAEQPSRTLPSPDRPPDLTSQRTDPDQPGTARTSTTMGTTR